MAADHEHDRRATNKTMETNGDADKYQAAHICAIGRITYSWNHGRLADRTGILVYIKSSLTGDENDYVYHYKKRYWAFPHETTARSDVQRGAVRGLSGARLPRDQRSVHAAGTILPKLTAESFQAPPKPYAMTWHAR